MDINLQELNAMIADFVQVGYMEAVRTYEPTNDLIRRSEVRKWLKIANIPLSRFQSLENTGLIKSFRRGEGVNSPLYYSKKEIKQALATAKISGLIARDHLNNI